MSVMIAQRLMSLSELRPMSPREMIQWASDIAEVRRTHE